MTTVLLLDLAIAAAGALLLSILLRAVLRDLKRHGLGRYRNPNPAVDELLKYALLLRDDVVLCRDGSFLAAWLYRGKDATAMTAEEQAYLHGLLNSAFKRLGTGWMVHVDAVRERAPTYRQSTFPDWVTQSIDDERRAYFGRQGAAYETYCVVTVTYLPPASVRKRGARIIFGEDGQDLAVFGDTIKALEGELPLKLTRLTSQQITTEDGQEVMCNDLLQFLHRCVTGDSHPIHVPQGVVETDLLIGQQPYFHGMPPRIGDKTIEVVSVEGFPVLNPVGFLNELSEMPQSYRWSTRFVFLDQHEALKRIERKRSKWRQKVQPMWDKMLNRVTKDEDEHAKSMVADGTAAITEIASGACAGGLYTSVIVLMDQDADLVEQMAHRVCETVKRRGLSAARVEDVNATEAFLGSLPGHGVENLRAPQMNTQNLAELIPTSTIWCGQEVAPCPMYPENSPPLMHCVAQGRTPYRLNLHVQDLGNTLILGPPGSGKSTLLALLAAQLRRYPGMSVFAFDKGQSLYALTAAIHAATEGRSGLHFSVGGENSLSFAPLEHLQTQADVVWALNWVDSLLAINGLPSTAAQRNMIGRELKRLNERGSRSLTDLVASVQDREVQEVLQMYTSDGAAGHLLDAECDGLSLSDFTVFEIEELMALDQKFALPVLSYLFRRIERSLTGQPAAIFLDEAWLMLGHPVFRQKLWEWLKVMRKANCIVVMATQSLADASESGIFEQLKEALGSKIFLPNANARSAQGAPLYQSMGLNAREIERIATAKPKRHYYHVTTEGQRLVELAVGPLAMSFCGISRKEDLATIKRLEAAHGHQWPAHWLRRRGVSDGLQQRPAPPAEAA